MQKHWRKTISIGFLGLLLCSSLGLAGCKSASSEAQDASAASSETASKNHMASSDQKSDWNLILVNETHRVDASLAPTVEFLPSGASVDTRIYDIVMQMLNDCNAEGNALNVSSAYRDYQWQSDLFQLEVNEHLEDGVSEQEAIALAKTEVAEPGTSEHQTGLAIDTFSENSPETELEESYADTPEGKWLAENCWKYGFIIRYPKGKQDITGVIYEPWHLRYVGKEAAKIITENHLTLEEYLGEA